MLTITAIINNEIDRTLTGGIVTLNFVVNFASRWPHISNFFVATYAVKEMK
jgi:hypothetical protein